MTEEVSSVGDRCFCYCYCCSKCERTREVVLEERKSKTVVD